MGIPTFNPNKAYGHGWGEPVEGIKPHWLNQNGFMYDPVTKDPLPGQVEPEPEPTEAQIPDAEEKTEKRGRGRSRKE